MHAVVRQLTRPPQTSATPGSRRTVQRGLAESHANVARRGLQRLHARQWNQLSTDRAL